MGAGCTSKFGVNSDNEDTHFGSLNKARLNLAV
jgi:hypothetical protein